MASVEVAEVRMWGRTIGAVSWDPTRDLAAFEYERNFQKSGIQLAPLTMPLGEGIFSFPELSRQTYLGLPGLLADVLPDKFGNILIDRWLAAQGRTAVGFSPIERLCYVGSRGMGALEFKPALGDSAAPSRQLDIARLVELASLALVSKEQLHLRPESALGEASLNEADLSAIIQVGTSAGGARAKAVIGWNEETGEVRSGQLDLPDGFSHWLLKFDGVSENRDKELADPSDFGRIEFAYSLMAKEAGIGMSRCRLLEEGGRAHFMTERFDRPDGNRMHMQSLAAIAHFDFNQAGTYSYEQVMGVMRRLGLTRFELEEQFRRAVFNVIARNQDDHTKNIAFLMDQTGAWSLSPAYDITYSYNPVGTWTSTHQMTINAKRDEFDLSDLLSLGAEANLSNAEAVGAIDQVLDAIHQWRQFATAVGVDDETAAQIDRAFRIVA